MIHAEPFLQRDCRRVRRKSLDAVVEAFIPGEPKVVSVACIHRTGGFRQTR